MSRVLLMLTGLTAVSAAEPPVLDRGAGGACVAAGPAPATAPREIYVPWEDLHVLLRDQPRRVMMARREFDILWAAAHQAAQQQAPRSAVITSADYHITADSDRALVTGELALEVLAEGLHAVPLVLENVGLRRARLDGQPAAIGVGDDGRTILFAEGRGPHALQLEMVTSIETTTAQQKLHFEVPTPAATRLHLQVPGDIELKAGARTIQRHVDQAAGITHFELLPPRGPLTVALSLNSRLQRTQRLVIARSVLIDEITAGSERLHATFSMDILHQAVDRFLLTIPDDFEVTTVDAALLARWGQRESGGRRILEVFLREPAQDKVVLTISALRVAAMAGAWSFPTITALDVQSQASVLGVLVDERLRIAGLDSAALIPIDTQALAQVMPGTWQQAREGAPAVRPVAAFYAPQASYELSAQFTQPQAELAVTSNTLLTLGDQEEAIRGGFALLPKVEKLFEFDFTAPADWQVTRVTAAGGQALPFERHLTELGNARFHVRLPQGLPAGQQASVQFQATRTPPGWLDDWTARTVTLPVFSVIQATRQTGAAAVATLDDFTVRPETLAHLIPLDEGEKGKYGLAGVETDLVYRFDRLPYEATLRVERSAARITARTYSFLAIEPELLRAHYEIVYDITEARARRLALQLPAGTPEALSIRGLAGAGIKEFSSAVQDGLRRWTVLLEEGQLGSVRLAVDFQQPLAETEATDLPLPIVQAAGVIYQSGIAAVEGSAELEVTVRTELTPADIGQLVDCEYQPGPRLLGVYAFISGAPRVSAGVSRPATCALPPVIVQRAELVMVLSAHGVSQSAARFALRTKIPFLEVQLPDRSTLWSAELDGSPARPQRDGTRLLLGLPAAEAGSLRDVVLVYETPLARPGLSGDVELAAPRLMLGEPGSTRSEEVPVADLLWHVTAPPGYRPVAASGTVTTHQLHAPPLAIAQLGRWLYRLAGGANLFYGSFFPHRAYELSRRAAARKTQAAGTGGQTAGEPDLDASSSQPSKQDASGERVTGKDAKAPGEPASSAAYWALEGVRSLKIDLQATGQPLTFTSLGEKPQLSIRLSHVRRLDALGWGLALAVVVAGLKLSLRPAGAQIRFIIVVAGAATVLPAVTASANLAILLNRVFLAAVWLVPLLLALGSVRRIARRWPGGGPAGAAITAALLAIGALLVPAAPARAAEEDPQNVLLDMLQPSPPITVPADAIILPYDPAAAAGGVPAEELLVPYDTFVELYERAHPQHSPARRPAAAFALAGSAFNAVLASANSVRVAGRIDIEVFTDDAVAIALPLSGGVLTRADLDGAPAQLGTARWEAPDAPAQAAGSPAPAVIVLHARGRGRHALDLEVHMGVQRAGGWRVAAGRLPAAPAAALTLRVPEAHTEVLLPGLHERHDWLTQRPDETIDTVLGEGGAIDVRWRPQISAGQVDRSMTAESAAVLDVQEDGLRLSWRVDLSFRGGQRDVLGFLIPNEYAVAKVAGGNVRGWSIDAAGAAQRLEVSLLKPALDHEQLEIELLRQGPVTAPQAPSLQAPVVQVEAAARHHGELTVRRSPMLDLRTVGVSGLTRTDLPSGDGSAGGRPGPLGIAAYESYRFASTPFTLELVAAATQAQLTAEVQSILRIAEQQRSLEARFVFHVSGRSVYDFAALLPADVELEQVTAPGTFDWDLMPEADRQRLRVHLAAGQRGEVSIVVRGTLGAPGSVETVPVPRLEAAGVQRQHGTIVVQADPLYEIRPAGLQGCAWTAGAHAAGWLDSAQRPLARLTLRTDGPEYGGTLNLLTRSPVVTCKTITNVRVTDRVLEETILLDFTIESAGIRSVSFLLPPRLRDARVESPLLRLTTIEPVTYDGAEHLRMHLELQDAVTGQLRVLARHDSALGHELQSVPLPIVETGHSLQRTIVLENAGRGELIVESQPGFEELSREQQAWRALAGILGSQPTQAFLATAQAGAAGLAYRVKERAAVQTAGARIGLAETWLVVDDSGTYRGVQVYRVDNTTEQFLEVQLPEQASLWTAQVAGAAVKPLAGGPAAAPGVLRIPLVKTAAGDLDYPVRLTYAGQLGPPGGLGKTEFPLLRTVNISAELSQVRLLLPESCAWLNFGGTMRRVREEGDLAAGYLAYQTKQAQRLAGTLQSAEEFSQIRAVSSLKQLEAELGRYQEAAQVYSSNDAFRLNSLVNAQVLEGAKQQCDDVERRLQETKTSDNRAALDQHFTQQSIVRARDVVNEVGYNFAVTPPLDQVDRTPGDGFDQGWFADHDLRHADLRPNLADKDGAGVAGKPQAGDDRLGALQKLEAPVTPQVAQQQELEEHNKKAGRKRALRSAGDEQDAVARYKAALEEQAPPAPGLPATPAAEARASGIGGAATTMDGPGTTAGQPQQIELGSAEGQRLAGGLVSLEVSIPPHGQVYLFTTPRGDARVHARALSHRTIQVLRRVGLLAIGAALVWALIRGAQRAVLSGSGLRRTSTLLMVAGALSVITGVVPVAGVAAAVLGVILRRRSLAAERREWLGSSPGPSASGA